MAVFDSSLTDPYISNLLSAAPNLFRSPSPSSRMPSSSVPNLIQFLESVPPPVTVLLIQLAPLISWLRWTAEVFSWKSHWTDPWLVLACWWAICLTANVVLRYLLPLALLLPHLLCHLPSWRATHPPMPPATEKVLSLSLSDITTLQSLIPSLPSVSGLPFRTAVRLTTLLFIPYIILAYIVPIPVLVGFAGTFLLTYRAPWAYTIRAVLWRSAYIRRFLLHVCARLTGIPSPVLKSYTRITDPQVPIAPASPPIRFLFTILECQRWWMGLDWTAALLPGERPSWCTVYQQPVSPPSAFNLPPPTTIYLPVPDGKRVKRTAKWKWDEVEWGILVNKDGTGAKRVEKKPPGLEDEEAGARIATKAASMFKERKASMSSRPEKSSTTDDQDVSLPIEVSSGPEHTGEEATTDHDGWIYGDNKWEGAGPRGGIGKYTRYRRWTRIAVLEETVGIKPAGAKIDRAAEINAPEIDLPQEEKKENEPESSRIVREMRRGNEEHEEGRPNLKQRLNATLQVGPNSP